jgi:hypothetical protein
VQIRGVNHSIDDLSTDVGDSRRQYACNQRQQCQSDAQGFVGAPHQVERAAAVGKYRQQIARPTRAFRGRGT